MYEVYSLAVDGYKMILWSGKSAQEAAERCEMERAWGIENAEWGEIPE